MDTNKKDTTIATPSKPVVRGYKVTDADMNCRGMEYELGQDYTLTGKPVRCGVNGLHFCRIANDCFNYYSFDSANRVFEVEAFGEIDEAGDKCATNGLRLLREIAWSDVLNIVNQGKNNTGRGNTGDRNTGDWNTGHWNTGHLNTGDLNTGHWNTGDRNTGIFCTSTPKTIEMFDKPSDWSYQDFLDSEVNYLKNRVVLVEWVSWPAMTDAEKEQYPRAETAEGYSKHHDYKQAHRTWWSKLDKREQGCITNLPNFDATIFFQVTGITI